MIVSPEHIVDLVQVERTPSNSFGFTFKNTSRKTILELCISAQRGSTFEEMVCMHGFGGGETLPAPGSTMSFLFDAEEFVSDEQPGQPSEKSLVVYAVVNTDGSHIGSKNILNKLEDHMLGVALETKRISDLLAACPDDSVTGLDVILPKIGTSQPSTTSADAVDRLVGNLSGKSLSGINQAYINSHLSLHTTDFMDGVALARNHALYEINDMKATAALSVGRGIGTSRNVSEAQLHGRADLARKVKLLSESQIAYLAAFKGAAGGPPLIRPK
jgi:hypothetical protein